MTIAAHNRIDMVGKRIGKLVVIDFSYTKGKECLWNCKCDCGNYIQVRGTSLRRENTRSCGCLKNQAYNWKGFGEISGCFWYNQKLHSVNSPRGKKKLFNLTIQEAWDLFVSQNRKCAISGVELTFSRNYRNDKKTQTASLDRINNSIGYVIDNVQWVHKDINRMKQLFSNKELIQWCKVVAKYNEY